MRSSRRLVPVLLLLGAGGFCACGKEPAGPSPEERERAAREAAFRKTAEEAAGHLARAAGLAREGRTEEAWVAWRAARDAAGETPDLARVAEAIRKAEAAREAEAAWKSVRRALNADRKAAGDEDRLVALARAVSEAKAFLERYPAHEGREEVEAGLGYAERELSLGRKYAESMAQAREHLAAERWREVAAAVAAAREIRETPETLDLLNHALRALTPEGMVFIPAGTFLAGRDRSKAFLGPFYIDRTEVTNAAYFAFVKATGHRAPPRFAGGEPLPGEEQKPVTGVTIGDALAYAAWAKRRLPTESEWERAARGTDGRAYPWGDEWDPAKGHFGSGGTLPVGGKPLDCSPEGVLDLAGNVQEITLPVNDPEGRVSGPVLKGGHWSDDLHPEYALACSRYPVAREHEDSGTGFRCALTAPPPP